MNTDLTLAFIGAGNMARAIIGGLLQQNFPATRIYASEPDISQLEDLQTQGVKVTDDNLVAAEAADIVILAVKPQILANVAKALASLPSGRLFISVAAGISTASLDNWLGGQRMIVRCMPNTPALVGSGASGLFANAQVSAEQKSQAESILAAVGLTLWVDNEELLHAITAVSGSGPAYYFLFMEAMIKAGIAQGLSPEAATALTLQTARGAAEMAQQSEHDPAELRRRVTSPNGTTEQAMLFFQQQQLETLVEGAMTACANRSKEMARALGDD